MRNIFGVIASCLKVGAIGFGGGSTLIPVTEKEVVEEKKLVTDEEFQEDVIVANITPGALPVKLGSAVGESVSGGFGSIVGALCMALPGTFLTILLLAVLSLLPSSAMSQVELASVGISVYIIYLLMYYINKIGVQSKAQNFYVGYILLTIIAFIITTESAFYSVVEGIFGVEIALPIVFGLSTMSVLELTFFVIFFTGGKLKSWRGAVAILLSVVFLVASGGSGLLAFDWVLPSASICMVLLAGFFCVKDTRAEIKNSGEKLCVDKRRALKIPAVCSGLFFAIGAVGFLLAIVFISGSEYISLLFQGVVSTITSFGGGSAYLTVASGLFVDSGIVSSSVFYAQLLPIANALPGPIVMKLFCGVCYAFTLANTGSVALAVLFAFCGYLVTVSATCLSFWLVFMIYRSFSSISVFATLKLWILPVVCGLLLSAVFSMMVEMLAITVPAGVNPYLTVAIFGGMYALAVLIKNKFKIADIYLILLCAAASVLILNII